MKRFERLTEAAATARVARKAVSRALRRPRTYSGALKEALWTGVNMAMYPAGVLSKATQEEDLATSLDGRYARELPLRYLDPEAAATPIILVHGYFHNRSAFLVMRRALRRAGFVNVSTLNYNVIGHDVRELAQQLGSHVERVLSKTGATHVHLIGHSLGGLVSRAYIQLFGGASKVHTCVTMGTPHGGTYAAWMGRGPAARDIRPRSELLTALEKTATSGGVRYVAYYSNLDGLVIPASSAKLTHPALGARNILVKDLGHMSFLMSQELIRSVADVLAHLDADPEDNVTQMPRKRSGGHRAEQA